MKRWLILALLVAFPAAAEPEVGDMYGPSVMSGGMICDTLGEVYDYIEAAATSDPSLHPPGCGRLMQPMTMTWQVIELYEAHHFRFVLVRFLLHTEVGPVAQFGIWGAPQQIDAPA